MKQFQNQVLKLSKTHKQPLEELAARFRENGASLEKAVLSHQTSESSRERFLERNAVLNHLVSTVIDTIAILNQMGFNDEEFEDRMEFTLIKMNCDAEKEESIRNRILPFEIHITLQVIKSQMDEFKAVCKELGTTPCLLKKPSNTGVCYIKSISVMSGNNRDAFLESLRIEEAFKKHGFDVVRRKIETTTWHPVVPVKTGDFMPRTCYFKALLSIILTPIQAQTISDMAYKAGGHLSFNNTKLIDENNVNHILSIRQYHGTLSEFDQKVGDIIAQLSQHSVHIEKTSVDFVIYDTEMMSDSVLMLNS